jgi:hypothetical protein
VRHCLARLVPSHERDLSELDQHTVAGVAVSAVEDPGEGSVSRVEDAQRALFESWL